MLEKINILKKIKKKIKIVFIYQNFILVYLRVNFNIRGHTMSPSCGLGVVITKNSRRVYTLDIISFFNINIGLTFILLKLSYYFFTYIGIEMALIAKDLNLNNEFSGDEF